MTYDPARLLIDSPEDGATNMARDEALLEAVGEGAAPPTLRLYTWSPPTISLGYFQPYADYEALPPPAGELAVVRRQTGGGAILHDQELTYAWVMPVSHPLLAEGATHLYELAHAAVIAALREFAPRADYSGSTDDSTPTRGPFFCFARRHRLDVLVGADKIAGSAQRRAREAVLQHGSIVLGQRFGQQPVAGLAVAFEDALATVREVFPRALTRDSGLAFEPGDWTEAELARAQALVAKYAGPEWTARR